MASFKPNHKVSVMRKRSTSINNLSNRNWIERVFAKRDCIQFIPSQFPFAINFLHRKCGCGRYLSEHGLGVVKEYEAKWEKGVNDKPSTPPASSSPVNRRSNVDDDDHDGIHHQTDSEFPMPPENKGTNHPHQLTPCCDADLIWHPERHTSTSLTNAYGTIEFQGVSHPHKAQYIRLSYDTNPERIFYLLTQVWGLELPKLLISIFGGIKNFDLNPKLTRLFHKGLLKAANTTGTWLFTEGLDSGYVKYVGDALGDRSSKCRSTIVAIGIAPWGIVQNKEDLVGKDVTVPYYSVMPSSPNLAALNSKHSYFLLADDGSVGKFGAEAILRRNLEKYLLHLKSRNSVMHTVPPSHLLHSHIQGKTTFNETGPQGTVTQGNTNSRLHKRKTSIYHTQNYRVRASVPCTGGSNYHTVSTLPVRKRTPLQHLYHYNHSHHLIPPAQGGKVYQRTTMAKQVNNTPSQGNAPTKAASSDPFRTRLNEIRSQQPAKRRGSAGSASSMTPQSSLVPIVGLLLNGGPEVAKRMAEYLNDQGEKIINRAPGPGARKKNQLGTTCKKGGNKRGAPGQTQAVGVGTMSPCHVVPVVVIDGSGGIADIITFVCGLHLDPQDSSFSELDLAKVTKMTHESFGLDETGTLLLISDLFTIVKNKKLVTLYKMGSSYGKDIDQDILCSLLKSSTNSHALNHLITHNATPVDQLNLALSWNRADIARTEIFVYGQRWPDGSLEKAFMDALIHDRVDFVKLLLENGVNIHKFLTIHRLEELYNSKYGPPNTLHYLIQDVKKNVPPDYRYTLPDIGAVINKLMGGVYRCSYQNRTFRLMYNSRNSQKNPAECGTKPNGAPGSTLKSGLARTLSPSLVISTAVSEYACKIFPQPFQDLMVWSVVTQRQPVSLFCWEMGDEPLPKALMATKLYKSMAKEAAEDDLETDMSEKCRQYAKEYAKLSIDLLEKCYRTKPDYTEQLLTYQLGNFSKQTCLSLAVAANHMEFIAHSCCQFLLGDLWMGGLRVRKSSALKVLMGLFIPFTIMTLEFKTLAQLQLMPQTLEEHINDLEQESADERDDDDDDDDDTTTADDWDDQQQFPPSTTAPDIADDDDYEMNFEKFPSPSILNLSGIKKGPTLNLSLPKNARLRGHSISVPEIKLSPPPEDQDLGSTSGLTLASLSSSNTIRKYVRRFITRRGNNKKHKTKPDDNIPDFVRESRELIGLHVVPEEKTVTIPLNTPSSPVVVGDDRPSPLHGSYHAQLLSQQRLQSNHKISPSEPSSKSPGEEFKDPKRGSSLWRIMHHFSQPSVSEIPSTPSRSNKSASVPETCISPKFLQSPLPKPLSLKKVAKTSLLSLAKERKNSSFLFFGPGAKDEETLSSRCRKISRRRKSSCKPPSHQDSLKVPQINYNGSAHESYDPNGPVPPPPHPLTGASNARSANSPLASTPPMMLPSSTTVLDVRTKFYEFYNAPITKFWSHTVAYFLFVFVYTYVVLAGDSAAILRNPIFDVNNIANLTSPLQHNSVVVWRNSTLSYKTISRQLRRLGVLSSWPEIFVVAFVVTFACEKVRECAASEAYGARHKIHLWFRDFWNFICFVAFTLFAIGLALKIGAALDFHTIKSGFIYNSTAHSMSWRGVKLKYVQSLRNQLIWSRFFYALSAIFWYIRILDILSFNKYLGPYVVMIGKMMMDMMVFVIIMAIVMACFGVARYAIRNPTAQPKWTLARDVFYQPYWMMYGEVFAPDINPDCSVDGSEPSCKIGDWISPALMALYLLVTNILLVNLLIAVFNHTFLKVSAISQQIWKFRRFNLTIEYEMKPILPPPLIAYCHIYRLYRFFYNRRRLGYYRGIETNFDYGLKLYLPDEDITKLHEFEKDCLDDLTWEKAHSVRSSLENQMFQTMDRLEDFSLRLDDLDQKQNEIRTAMATMNKKLSMASSTSGRHLSPNSNVTNPYVLNSPFFGVSDRRKSRQGESYTGNVMESRDNCIFRFPDLNPQASATQDECIVDP